MSTKYVPAGQTTDFDKDPNISLMELLRDNWDIPVGSLSPNTPVKEELKFGTTWETNTKSWYSIHVRREPNDVIPKIIGFKRFRHKDNHDVHLFARGKGGKDKLWKMELEVSRILALKARAPFTGISWLIWTGPRQAAQNREDRLQDIFHSIFSVELNYDKILQ